MLHRRFPPRLDTLSTVGFERSWLLLTVVLAGLGLTLAPLPLFGQDGSAGQRGKVAEWRQQVASPSAIALVGEIDQPGVYEFPPGSVTLQQALRAAGGPTTRCASEVRIVRQARTVLQVQLRPDGVDRLEAGDVVHFPAIASERSAGPRVEQVEHVQVVMLGVLGRPIVVKMKADLARADVIARLLAQSPEVLQSTRLIGRPSFAASSEQPALLATGNVLVFDPRAIDARRLPEFPAVIAVTNSIEGTVPASASTAPLMAPPVAMSTAGASLGTAAQPVALPSESPSANEPAPHDSLTAPLQTAHTLDTVDDSLPPEPTGSDVGPLDQSHADLAPPFDAEPASQRLPAAAVVGGPLRPATTALSTVSLPDAPAEEEGEDSLEAGSTFVGASAVEGDWEDAPLPDSEPLADLSDKEVAPVAAALGLREWGLLAGAITALLTGAFLLRRLNEPDWPSTEATAPTQAALQPSLPLVQQMAAEISALALQATPELSEEPPAESIDPVTDAASEPRSVGSLAAPAPAPSTAANFSDILRSGVMPQTLVAPVELDEPMMSASLAASSEAPAVDDPRETTIEVTSEPRLDVAPVMDVVEPAWTQAIAPVTPPALPPAGIPIDTFSTFPTVASLAARSAVMGGELSNPLQSAMRSERTSRFERASTREPAQPTERSESPADPAPSATVPPTSVSPIQSLLDNTLPVERQPVTLPTGLELAGEPRFGRTFRVDAAEGSGRPRADIDPRTVAAAALAGHRPQSAAPKAPHFAVDRPGSEAEPALPTEPLAGAEAALAESPADGAAEFTHHSRLVRAMARAERGATR